GRRRWRDPAPPVRSASEIGQAEIRAVEKYRLDVADSGSRLQKTVRATHRSCRRSRSDVPPLLQAARFASWQWRDLPRRSARLARRAGRDETRTVARLDRKWNCRGYRPAAGHS